MNSDERAKWLAEAKARADAASPAPWAAVGGDLNRGSTGSAWGSIKSPCGDLDLRIATVENDADGLHVEDAQFIAAARSDVPRLLAEIELLDEAVARLVLELEFGKRLMDVAKASARYVASHRFQAVRLQGAEDKSEYVAAAKALDEALAQVEERIRD